VKRNLPGRGLWVTATRTTLDQAIKRKLFAKGFKRDVRSGPELADLTERLLEKSVLDALAIAGKAGEVVTGFTKVEAAIAQAKAQHGGLVAVMHAADGSLDGARKIAAALNRNPDDDSPELPVIRAFSGAQLDLALGRPNVIHAALLAGPASQGFLMRCLRFMRFRTGETGWMRRDDALDKEPKGTESE
jgi:hypothetical protein